MKIKLSESGEIILSPEYLAGFAKRRVRDGAVAYRPSVAPYGDPVPCGELSYKTASCGEDFIICGSPDGVFRLEDQTVVWMTRRQKRVTPSVSPYSDPVFLAKAYAVSHLVCEALSLDGVTLKITVEGENGERHFDIALDAGTAKKITDGLVERASFFAIVEKNFETRGRRDIAAMPFPYSSIRDGQEEFIREAYRAIKRGEKLLVSAPTGIGKTVSALFPAVKAIGDGSAEKIFYLTAKTVTGLAAAKTAEVMRKFAPDLRAVVISAKERVCPSNDKKNEFHVDRCTFDCPRLSDNGAADYASRRIAALEELLSSGGVYGKAEISACAEKYGLCPYELSLDLSEHCAIVICDYNYVIDPKVKFRRYFSEGDLKYVLLFDEAHNLPDRTRESFSSSLSSSEISKLKEASSASDVPDAELIKQCALVQEALAAQGEKCSGDAEEIAGERTGYIIEDKIPQQMIKAVQTLAVSASKARGDADAQVAALADGISKSASDFIKAADVFDERFALFSELRGNEITCRALCLDPSSILERSMSGAVSSILFSATLSPADYFLDVTGCKNASYLDLESPYPPENLAVAVADGISTKYLSRADSAEEVAEAILAVTEARRGHYIVYFPSYKYLDTVFNAFRMMAPKGYSALVQKPSMSLDARRRFLSFFENSDGETLVGFCVLGGIFSEGIDLPDDKLIGAILVGIGLPSLSSELNILKEYYDRTREDGYDFAYLYPALIKISQAAGRVIRDERDRGVIVLIDDRYRDPKILKLLPRHWKNIHVTGSAAALGTLLKRFWDEKDSALP